MAVTRAVLTAHSLEEAIRADHMVEGTGVLGVLVDLAEVFTAIVFFNDQKSRKGAAASSSFPYSTFNPRMIKA